MTGPDIRYAQAGKKSKASDYNHNFDEMVSYIDTIAGGLTDYVDSFMPSQTGNAGKLLTTNGTSASWIYFGGNLPSGSFIEGLIITKSNNNTIAVSKGSCYDSTRIKVLSLASAATKQNASQTANTIYYVYIIGTSTTGIDILISTSENSPTLPTNYVYYRMIGYYETNSEGNIDSIVSYGTNTETDHTQTLMPDYTTMISIPVSEYTYTAPSNGWISITIPTGNAAQKNVKVNNVIIGSVKPNANCWGSTSVQAFVRKNDVITWDNGTGGEEHAYFCSI